MKSVYLVGYASDLGGAYSGSSEASFVIKNSPFWEKVKNIKFHWDAIIQPGSEHSSKIDKILQLSHTLAERIDDLTQQQKMFAVIGGDHSSAIGTWSGARHALNGDLGLIWIDAHMDSHTFDTTETGNIHGMPLASLLGKGDPRFTELMGFTPKLKPENVCLIGVRSFERGEADLLEQLNVRVFFMDEVKRRGLSEIMKEAIEIVSKRTVGFGLSLDIDSIDPSEAPGTGVCEPDGLSGIELCKALTLFSVHPKFVGTEIVEFDPSRDVNQLTEKLFFDLLLALFNKKGS